MAEFYECHKVTAGVVDLAWEAAIASNVADTDFKRTDGLIVAIDSGKEPFGWGSINQDKKETLEIERAEAARRFRVLSSMAAVVMMDANNCLFAKSEIKTN